MHRAEGLVQEAQAQPLVVQSDAAQAAPVPVPLEPSTLMQVAHAVWAGACVRADAPLLAASRKLRPGHRRPNCHCGCCRRRRCHCQLCCCHHQSHHHHCRNCRRYCRHRFRRCHRCRHLCCCHHCHRRHRCCCHRCRHRFHRRHHQCWAVGSVLGWAPSALLLRHHHLPLDQAAALAELLVEAERRALLLVEAERRALRLARGAEMATRERIENNGEGGRD